MGLSILAFPITETNMLKMAFVHIFEIVCISGCQTYNFCQIESDMVDEKDLDWTSLQPGMNPKEQYQLQFLVQLQEIMTLWLEVGVCIPQ